MSPEQPAVNFQRPPSPEARIVTKSDSGPRAGEKTAETIAVKLMIMAFGRKSSGASRETLESVVLAVILAFLFRGFEAEAFVIPTGSMAPTLQGRHMDVECEQCGYRYRTGASNENADSNRGGFILQTTCPICHFTMNLKRAVNPTYHGPPDPNQESFNGDRILVSKFAYDLSDPQRWDVIVFKYPGNAKQNYIKRLVGLPGETIRIRHGDIYVKHGDEDWQIARKEPPKLKGMLQLVDDTDFIGQKLVDAKWPSRWQDWSGPHASAWNITTRSDGQKFVYDGSVGEDVWLRYRHVPPWGIPKDNYGEDRNDWSYVFDGKLPPRDFDGELISDYYAYNDGEDGSSGAMLQFQGLHWVGDLAVEAEVDVQSDTGELLLDLVEGGVHYGCRINVADGQATLSIDDGGGETSDAPASATETTAKTSIRGAGSYRLRFCNADNELTLWVNDRVVKFDGPTTFDPGDDVAPQWSPSDPGDAEPIGVGSRGAAVTFTRLKVLRDIYYVAANSSHDFDYRQGYQPFRILEVLATPSSWNNNPLFADRGEAVFELQADPAAPQLDQFFPLGDNSPASKDARLWPRDRPFPPPYVERRLLTGKALVIYWPHSWNRPILFTPNFSRMKFIR